TDGGVVGALLRLDAQGLLPVGAAILGKGVEAGLVVKKVERAVQIVGATLGHDLNLCARVAAIGSIVGGGESSDLADCLLVGCHDRGAAVGERVDGDTVDAVGIVSYRLPIR